MSCRPFVTKSVNHINHELATLILSVTVFHDLLFNMKYLEYLINPFGVTFFEGPLSHMVYTSVQSGTFQ